MATIITTLHKLLRDWNASRRIISPSLAVKQDSSFFTVSIQLNRTVSTSGMETPWPIFCSHILLTSDLILFGRSATLRSTPTNPKYLANSLQRVWLNEIVSYSRSHCIISKMQNNDIELQSRESPKNPKHLDETNGKLSQYERERKLKHKRRNWEMFQTWIFSFLVLSF